MDEFISVIKLILSSTFFTFNNKIYKQTFGTLVSSPLSPIIADIVLQNLKEKTLTRINLNILFYLRYVDDIILAASLDQISNILSFYHHIYHHYSHYLSSSVKNFQ